MENTAPGYECLSAVLQDAFEQASGGKGRERHATDLPFDQQPMQKLCDLYGPGFALGQAAKKSQESQRLPYERARAELLGAIVYTAGAVIALDRAQAKDTETVRVRGVLVGVNDLAAAPQVAALRAMYDRCNVSGGCENPALCAKAGACQG